VDLDIIGVVIQGGAVGLLLTFGFLGYKIAMKLINVGQSLITNHLGELTDEVRGVREELARLSERLPGRNPWAPRDTPPTVHDPE